MQDQTAQPTPDAMILNMLKDEAQGWSHRVLMNTGRLLQISPAAADGPQDAAEYRYLVLASCPDLACGPSTARLCGCFYLCARVTSLEDAFEGALELIWIANVVSRPDVGWDGPGRWPIKASARLLSCATVRLRVS